MPSAATLLVLVVAAGDHDPLSDALERAAHQTLGADAAIVVKRVDALPADAQAAAMGDAAHATAIAEVAWSDAEHRRARLHVRASSDGAWVDREIGFASSDAPAEQGRTIGFALASMLPDAAPASSGVARPPEALPPAPAASPETPPRAPPPEPPVVSPGDIEASAVVAQAFGGYGGGIGGALAGSWVFAPPFVARIGGALRTAEVAPAAATSLVGAVGIGLGWRAIEPTPARRLGLGVRVDALVVVQTITHFDGDDNAPDHQSHVLPGADAMVEGSWLFTSGGVLVLAAGPEVAFGTTDVHLSGRSVTQLPPLRAVFEAGIRARF